MNDIQITKIKAKDGKITIEYESKRKDDKIDKVKIECHDLPKKSFFDQFDILRYDLVTICEFPLSFIDRVTIIGVSFSWTDDVMGATITGLLALKNSNAPLVINTPHKPETSYSGGDIPDSNLLPDDSIRNLSALLREAKAYIEGFRETKQLNLFTYRNLTQLFDETKDQADQNVELKEFDIVNK